MARIVCQDEHLCVIGGTDRYLRYIVVIVKKVRRVYCTESNTKGDVKGLSCSISRDFANIISFHEHPLHTAGNIRSWFMCRARSLRSPRFCSLSSPTVLPAPKARADDQALQDIHSPGVPSVRCSVVRFAIVSIDPG